MSEVLLVQAVLVAGIASLFVWWVWRWVMTDEERRILQSVLARE
jgi:hypothetical protein